MANLQDIRRRIRSVRGMQQLTKALKMVSAAKLRRASDRVVAARPYSETMDRVFSRLAQRAGDFKHPLLSAREEDNHYVLALVTADRGLCGGFNANLIKTAQNFIREHPSKKIELVPIGKKGRDFFRRRQFPLLREYINITARTVDHADAAEIARSLMDLFTAEDSTIDRVYLVYSEFKSAMSQRIITKQLLPVEKPVSRESEAIAAARPDEAKVFVEYLYEQPAADIFGALLPRYVDTQVYHALLESVASEQGARMTAMDAASKNAGDVISSLTLNMNRVRQASITREIIEVVSGAQALE
jgi:F-type H+-transporting ATPase subunit gamma